MKKIYKKFLFIILFLSILFSFCIPTYANENYTSQIAINLTVPENFDLPCYAVFYNVTTDQEFQVNLIKENNYRGRVSVPAGDYLVAQISVVDDVTCKYPFSLGDDFTLTEKNNITIESILLNYDEVQEKIDNYIDSQSSEEVIVESTEELEKEEIIEEVVDEPIEEEKDFPMFIFIIIIIAVVLFLSFICLYIYKNNND